jgi:hypothetical protein
VLPTAAAGVPHLPLTDSWCLAPQYNAPDAPICEFAARLEAIAERLMAEWMPSSGQLPPLSELNDDKCQVCGGADSLPFPRCTGPEEGGGGGEDRQLELCRRRPDTTARVLLFRCAAATARRTTSSCCYAKPAMLPIIRSA